MTPPLYARVMGENFAALPPLVRTIHDFRGSADAAGEGCVVRGRHLLAQAIAWIGGFPPSGAYPLRVAFAEFAGRERWTRHFGGHCFSSELSGRGNLVVERFGAMRFGFALPAGPEGLAMLLRRWSVCGIRLPLCLAPRVAAREWEAEGRFRFDVRLSFPLIGGIVHYWGWLKPLRQ